MNQELDQADNWMEVLDTFFVFLAQRGYSQEYAAKATCIDMVQAVMRQQPLESPEELRDLLRPLICKTAQQQKDFNGHFAAWWSSIAGKEAKVSSARTHEDKVEVPVKPKNNPEKFSWGKFFRYLMVLVVLIFLAVLVDQYIRGGGGGGGGEKLLPKVFFAPQTKTTLIGGDLSDSIDIKIANWIIVRNCILKINSDSQKITLDSIKSYLAVEDLSFYLYQNGGNKIVADFFPNFSTRDTILAFTLYYSWTDPNPGQTTLEIDSQESYVRNYVSQPHPVTNTATLELKKDGNNWWVAGLLSGVFFFILLLFDQRNGLRDFSRKYLARKRKVTRDEDRLSYLYFSDEIRKIRKLWQWLPQANKLRYRPYTADKTLNLERSIRKTSAHLGMFTPVYQPKVPEATFVAFLDRKSIKDHQADFAEAFLTALQEKNIRLTTYYFDKDPQRLFDVEQKQWLSLETVKSFHPDSHAIFFSDLTGLYDSLTGKLYPWSANFAEGWLSAGIFSPENLKPHHFTYRDYRDLGLEIHPFTSVGIGDYINEKEKVTDTGLENKLPHFLPPLLNDDQLTSIFQPHHIELEDLDSALVEYLGLDGYLWLSACAVFPQLHLELTLYLGLRLLDPQYPEHSPDSFRHEIFSRLIRLPWLREGYMPDWLRDHLLEGLLEQDRKRIRYLINDFVNQHEMDDETRKSIKAQQSPSLVAELKETFARTFFRQEPADSPFRDELFLSFMAGRGKFKLSRNKHQLDPAKTGLKTAENSVNPPALWQLIPFYVLIVFGLLTLSILSFGMLPLYVLLTSNSGRFFSLAAQQLDVYLPAAKGTKKSSKNGDLSLREALIPIIFLISLLTINMFYSDGMLLGDYSNQYIFLFSGVVAGAIGLLNKTEFSVILNGVWANLQNVIIPIVVLCLVGALAGTWLVSGVIPTMIYYGLQLLSPEIFLPASVIITAIVSMATGSSWTTSATVGISLVGMGEAMGIGPGMIAGAVISGAYFGDKISPLSDTTNLAPAMAGTDLFTHIRYMTITTVPSIIVTLVVFAVLSFTIDISGNADISNLLASVDRTFNITPLLFIVPVIVIALIVAKTKPLIALGAGVLLAGAFALIFQAPVLAGIGEGGIVTVVQAIFTDTSVATDNPQLNDLFSTGGMIGMLWTILLLISAMIFGGVMEGVGALDRITHSLLDVTSSAFGLFASTVASCLALNVTVADQYFSVVVPGKIFARAYHDRGLAPENLSRTLEDSGTVTSVLVPWSSGGAFHSVVLNVSVGEYFVYAIFNYLSPFMTLLFVALNIKIRMLGRKVTIK